MCLVHFLAVLTLAQNELKLLGLLDLCYGRPQIWWDPSAALIPAEEIAASGQGLH